MGAGKLYPLLGFFAGVLLGLLVAGSYQPSLTHPGLTPTASRIVIWGAGILGGFIGAALAKRTSSR